VGRKAPHYMLRGKENLSQKKEGRLESLSKKGGALKGDTSKESRGLTLRPAYVEGSKKGISSKKKKEKERTKNRGST